MIPFRIGIGFDVHRLVSDRKFILGGVEIPHETGLLGHSDADVLIHALIDSLLGASSLGDIGTHFPDTSAKYKNISSISLLESVYSLLQENSIFIVNIDSVVICQRPKIMPYAESMKKNISIALGNLDTGRIGIKATTTEKAGFIGREEAVAVQTVALISKNV
jgi:2-C-methyl-D-erythritol 2,4-cyclodiphosphate synthase